MGFIRDHDLFGHPVLLTFNKKGTHYNTSCGGCVSIIIKVFMMAILVFLIDRLVNNRQDTISSTKEPVDFKELGEVDLEKEGTFIIFLIFDTLLMRHVPYNADFRKHIEI